MLWKRLRYPTRIGNNKRMFESMFYRDFLGKLKLKLRPAELRGEDHCCQSGFCCWARPGALTQDDLKKLAVHKGISEQEFFEQYCVVDNPGSSVWCPTLRRKHQEGGKFLSDAETFSVQSPCVFLSSENKCEVHEVKPTECQAYKCWEPAGKRPKFSWTIEELLELGWDGLHSDDDDDEF